ncbi:unnamed protein product [Dracunculus medinensis]|uniref:Hemagglutinin n=1 Tax=Dracunculus medinensis TaxID=318479 RepID=A0A0N4UE34_DRAME|nr:unnamed protein product [Dracunculus medinensis]
MVSGRTEHFITQSGKCVTNNSIILWNGTEISKNCPYKRIGIYDGAHLWKPCNYNNFTKPYRMDDDIIIDMGQRTKNLLPAINIVRQRSCQNRNNSLPQIGWLSS